ncbi:MAG: Ca-activated chloride channel [Bryobacterales bacterium]|jgi:Ca-activated chloride channel family protein|nr:Ca-activated chloride channel [Bryobacterales bacterium]
MPTWKFKSDATLCLRKLVFAACCASLVAGQPLQKPESAGLTSFSTDANLVLVPVTVTDRYGKTISDLKPEHFRVSDGSKPRDIVSFGRVDAPVAMGVVLDLSTSMHRKLPFALAAARAVIDTLSPEDAGYLVTFDKTPELRVGFTRDVESLGESLLFSTAQGNTALFDAIGLALRHGREGKGFRKVLLVISDGGDNRSRLMESDLVSAALEADTQIYCIGVHERLRARDEVAGAHFMERLATLTGGLKFDVRTEGEVQSMAHAISLAMKDQYLIGFKPHDEVVSGKWRKVRISVDVPGIRSLRVSAKSGYFNP